MKKTITVCCVCTDHPNLGLLAIERTQENIPAAQVIFFTTQDFIDKNFNKNKKITWVPIPKLNNINDYNHFIINELEYYITTSHVLIVQWDGFAVNKYYWDESFLEYDYIGASWPQFKINSVGNGGFSLRSLKLLKIASVYIDFFDKAEDLIICRDKRIFFEKSFKIKYAPIYIANKFSKERSGSNLTFGFHGLFNFPYFVPFEHFIYSIRQLSWEELVRHDVLNILANVCKTDRFTLYQKISSMLCIFLVFSSVCMK